MMNATGHKAGTHSWLNELFKHLVFLVAAYNPLIEHQAGISVLHLHHSEVGTLQDDTAHIH